MKKEKIKALLDNILSSIDDETYDLALELKDKGVRGQINFDDDKIKYFALIEDKKRVHGINIEIDELSIFYRCTCGKENCIHVTAAIISLKNSLGTYTKYLDKNIFEELMKEVSKNTANKFVNKVGLFVDENNQAVIRLLESGKRGNKFADITTEEFFHKNDDNDYEKKVKDLCYLDSDRFYNNKLYLKSFESLKNSEIEIMFEKDKPLSFLPDVEIICEIIKESDDYSVKWSYIDIFCDKIIPEDHIVIYSKYDMAFKDSEKKLRLIKIKRPVKLQKFSSGTIEINNKEEFFKKYFIPLSNLGVKFNLEKSDLYFHISKPEFELFIFRIDNKFRLKLKIKYDKKEYTLNELKESEIIRNEEEEKRLFENLKKYDITLDENGENIWNVDRFVYFLKNEINSLEQNIKVLYSKEIKLLGSPKVSVNGKKEKNWFDVDIKINEEDLFDYLDNIKKSKYIILKDGSIVEIPENIKNITRKINRNSKRMKLFELIDCIDYTEGELSEVFEKFRNFEKIDNYEIPEIKGNLRNYQKHGYNFLRYLNEFEVGGILADDMGLGKTVQTISLIKSVKTNKPDLIICPKSVIYNWANELEKFSELTYNIYMGSNRKLEEKDIILTTYSTLRNSEELFSIDFNYIILDEAQYIKNDYTQTSKAIKLLTSDYKLALTGTPIENSILDVYNIFNFLMPDYLGNKKEFLELTATKEGKNSIYKKIKPFILRRTKEQVLKELPPKIEENIYVEMEPEQQDIYNDLIIEIRNKLYNMEDSKFKFNALEGLLRLRQTVCHPKLLFNGYQGNSGKFEELKEFLEDIIESDHKVIIFSQFVEMLRIIESYLNHKEIKYEIITGDTKNRFEVVEKFNGEPEIKILLASLKAGGTGLNITGADYVVHYDPWWNPAVENQATDRAYRFGQTKNVFVYRFITKNSVEEKIVKLKELKNNLYKEFISEESLFKDLSREDFEELLND